MCIYLLGRLSSFENFVTSSFVKLSLALAATFLIKSCVISTFIFDQIRKVFKKFVISLGILNILLTVDQHLFGLNSISNLTPSSHRSDAEN